MICEKTGCVAFSEEYSSWMVGDLYITSGGTYVMKISSETFGRRAPREYVNLVIHQLEAKWDLHPYGVVICQSVTYHGTEGINPEMIIG